MTLRRTFARCLVRNVVVVAAFVTASLVGLTQVATVTERPLVEGSPAALIEAHDCWTGPAPVGAVAERVVVTVGTVTRVGGQRLTDMALEQVLFGVDHGLVVHAFCEAA